MQSCAGTTAYPFADGDVRTNRPDVPTGYRIMRGHRVPTYPHNPVTQIDTPGAWLRTPGYVEVTGPSGSRATMTIESCHATCYLLPGAIIATDRVRR